MSPPADTELPEVVRRHLRTAQDSLARLPWSAERVAAWATELHRVLAGGGRLLAAGNGGSASLAQHLTSELVGRYQQDRPPFSAVCLSSESSAVTAIANDYGYDEVFARQVRAHGRRGDVLVLLTTSGRSRNLLRAAEEAARLGVSTLALTGPAPNPLLDASDDALAMHGTPASVQEAQHVVVHALCAAFDALVLPDAHAGEAPGGHRSAAPLAVARPPSPADQARLLAEAVRSAGGRLVAAGGCFDLLHAGHVDLLQRARALGDALVVLLNDDRSVRRLKGPTRPLVPAEDRAAVLQALECVDAVAVFGEDTPELLLQQLRPDVFCKGGDYEGRSLPEEEVLATWGGRLVVLPLVQGRSTTRLVDLARRSAS
jgi:rfaE bifunctional protein nucleotidyltransferase chain/domain